MVENICKNNQCGFSPRCPLRRSATTEAKRKDAPPCQFQPGATASTPAPAAPKSASWDDPVQFTMRPESCGWIGLLFIRGAVENEIVRALREVEAEFPTLAGLMIIYDCPGGDFLAGEMLERTTLVAKQTMPVVAFVKSAHSTALIPARAAHRVYADANGELGTFGIMTHVCDGKTAKPLVNRQSPQKCPDRRLSWPPRRFIVDDADLDRLQTLLDCQYEADLFLVARYAGRDTEALRSHLDGRTMSAEEAMVIGLVDGILTEHEAYKKLVKMVNERSQTNEVKKEKKL